MTIPGPSVGRDIITYEPNLSKRRKNLGGDRGLANRAPGTETRYGDSNRQPTGVTPKPSTGSTASKSSIASTTQTQYVRSVQTDLAKQGYDVGPIDGIWGPKTQQAYNEWMANGKQPKTSGGGGGAVTVQNASPAPVVSSPAAAPPPTVKVPSVAPGWKPKQGQELVDLANASVNAELGPLLGALTRQMEQSQKDYDRQKADLTARGARGSANLQEMTKRLSGFIGNMQNRQAETSGQAGAATQNMFADLIGNLGKVYSGAAGNVSAEAAKSGFGDYQPGQIEADGAYLMGRAAGDRANALSNQVQMKQDFDMLMQMMQGNAQTEGYSRTARWNEQIESGLQDLTQTLNDALYELRGQWIDTEGTRGNKTRELLDMLEDREWGRMMEVNQSDFTNQLARDQFGLSTQAQQQQWEQSQMDYDLQIADAIAKDRAEKQKALQDAAKEKKATGYKGLGGVSQYLADENLGSDAEENRMRRYVTQAMQNSRLSPTDPAGYNDLMHELREVLQNDGNMHMLPALTVLFSILNGTY